MTESERALTARIARLEAERRQSFEDAQREADALFAQYQLTQLIASGGTTEELARAVVTELVRLAGGAGGALWAESLETGRDGSDLHLLAVVGAVPVTMPGRIVAAEALAAWTSDRPGTATIALSDEPPRAVLTVWPADGAALDPEGVRIAASARHELAIAIRGTRLREALERERTELAAIVENATDVIVGVDDEGRVTRLNPAGRRLLGLDAAAPTGRRCDDLLGCEVAGGHARDACPLREVIRSGRPIDYREVAVRAADGRTVRMAGSFAPLGWTTGSREAGPGGAPAPRRDGDGSAATAILRDVSAARALEALREGFVATVSHELRTPIALIRGYTETLLHLELSPTERRAMIDRIHDVTGRLTTLVDQILDVTHLDAHPVTLERAPTSLPALVARLRADLAAAGRAVTLAFEAPADLPPLDVDGARIGQVLENLVANSVKYGREGGPVRIVAVVEQGRAVIAVEDEGIGIPRDERALVLEPFHRAGNVRESRIPGTGLGLAICRRLVEAHGGRLVVADRPDGRAGTRVTFDLPLAPARPAPAAMRDLSSPPGPGR